MVDQQGIEELLSTALKGDKKAEQELFSKLYARILGLVQQKIWNKEHTAAENKQIAEDLTQDIYLVIFQKYMTATYKNGFLPWVFQIARNKIGDHFRHIKRVRRVLTGNPAEEDQDQPVSNEAVTPDKIFEYNELKQLIRWALKKIKKCCRSIIQALMEGRIKDYISEQLQNGIRINTIYAHIHRCRKEFKNKLYQEGYVI